MELERRISARNFPATAPQSSTISGSLGFISATLPVLQKSSTIRDLALERRKLRPSGRHLRLQGGLGIAAEQEPHRLYRAS